MRLLHTSDWHLGRSLLGVSLLADQAAFCDQLIDLTHDFRPDLVVILGDLFERSTPSEEAVAVFDNVLQRLLLECKVRVLIAPGQQDGMRRLSFGSWMYERRQLHLVTTVEAALSPIMVEDADGPVHVNVLPFLRPLDVDQHFRSQKITTHAQAGNVVMDHLTRFRRLRRKAVRAVVAGYLWVEGGEPCGEERPLDAGQDTRVALSAFDGLNYGALGYLHQHQVLGGDHHVVYSGSPFAFSFESNPAGRGPVRMEMDGAGKVHSEQVPFPARRHFWRFAGSLERLLLGPVLPLDSQDVVVLELSHDSDLLSAELIQRLRTLYPNLWRIERPEAVRKLPRGGDLDPVQSFADFYQSATGGSLDEESRMVVQDIFQDRQQEPA